MPPNKGAVDAVPALVVELVEIQRRYPLLWTMAQTVYTEKKFLAHL